MCDFAQIKNFFSALCATAHKTEFCDRLPEIVTRIESTL